MKRSRLVRWVVTGLAGLPAIACAQHWHEPHVVPFFQATEQQARAWTQQVCSVRCESNLGSIGYAARIYASEHNGRFPTDWASFTNEIARVEPLGPQTLYCPADTLHLPASDWGTVDTSSLSYDLVSPGMREADWWKVFARCLVHGNVIFGDGVVEAARPYDRRPIPLAATGSAVFNLSSVRIAADAGWSAQCLSQLQQIGLATRIYALDSEDWLPPGFAAITNELGRARILVCPADLLAQRPVGFADLDPDAISYVLEAAGMHLLPDQTGVRVASCRIHGHSVNNDGATTSGTNRYPPRLIQGHPLSQTVTPGQHVALAVLTGDSTLAPFRYQWRRVGLFDAAGLAITNVYGIEGATNRSFEIASATAADEGYYDVVVEDVRGQRQLSHLAYLRVEATGKPRSLSGWETNACVANLGNLLLASRFAQAGQPQPTKDLLPGQISELAPFLGWPLALFCPADAQHEAPENWDALREQDASYLIGKGASSGDSQRVFAACKVHGLEVLADGRIAWPGVDALRPRLDPPERLPDGAFSIRVRGIAGFECSLDVSANLNDWVPWARGRLGDGPFQVTIPPDNETEGRFYRALLVRCHPGARIEL
jgi:hypothetical protein